jgi:tripartite-type tricarboxylate transporter receptor subunit TctC
VVNRLNKEIVAVVRSPDAADALNKAGAEPVTSTPAELANMVKDGVKKYAAAVKRAGVKLE